MSSLFRRHEEETTSKEIGKGRALGAILFGIRNMEESPDDLPCIHGVLLLRH